VTALAVTAVIGVLGTQLELLPATSQSRSGATSGGLSGHHDWLVQVASAQTSSDSEVLGVVWPTAAGRAVTAT
jgi:hypothetical protein